MRREGGREGISQGEETVNGGCRLARGGGLEAFKEEGMLCGHCVVGAAVGEGEEGGGGGRGERAAQLDN